MLEADERWSVNQVYVYLTGIFPSPNEALSELMRAVYFGGLPITASGPTEAFPEAFQKSAFQSGAFQSASAGESMSYELDASWFPNHLTLRPREGGGVEIFPTRAIRAGPEIPLAILKEIVGSEAVAEEVETSIDRFNEIKFTARASVVRRLWPTTSIAGAQAACRGWLKGIAKEFPDRPPYTKAEMWAQARKRWPKLSERAFDRSWARVIKECGVKWGRPGRPRKTPQ